MQLITRTTDFGIINIQATVAAIQPTINGVEFQVVGGLQESPTLTFNITSVPVGVTSYLITINKQHKMTSAVPGVHVIDLAGIWEGAVPTTFPMRIEALVGTERGENLTLDVTNTEVTLATLPIITAPSGLAVGSPINLDSATFTGGLPDSNVEYLERYSTSGGSGVYEVDVHLVADTVYETGVSSWVEVGLFSANNVFPNNIGDIVRVRADIGMNGDAPVSVYSNELGPIIAVDISIPPALTTAQIVVEDPFYRPTGQVPETWRTSRLTLTGVTSQLLDVTLSEYRWSASLSDPTDANTEQCTRVSSTTLEMIMDDPLKRYTNPALTNFDLVTGKRLDYSVHRDADVTAEQISLQYRLRPTAVAAWGPWSFKSVYYTIPKIIIDPPTDDANLDHKQIIWRLEKEYDATPIEDNGWTHVIGGEGLQWFHANARGVSDPDRCIGVQDMGAVRCSDDGGLTWYSPIQDGLRAFASSGIYIDPVDEDFVLYSGAHTWDPVDATAAGIWLSEDFCKSFVKAQAIANVYADNTCRWAKRIFARWPVATGAPSAARFLYIANIEPIGSTGFQNTVIWASVGGQPGSWSQKNSISFGTFGRVGQILQHPTTQNTAYVLCENGVFESTDVGATTPTWAAKWAATFGNASGVTRMWINPANTSVIFIWCGADSTTKRGFYWTINGGTSWNRELTDTHACNGDVGANNAGKRMVYVHSRGRTATVKDMPQMREWNGSSFNGSWHEPTTINASAPGITEAAWKKLSGYSGQSAYGGFCEVMPHPTDPDEALLYGYHYYWKTSDGGATWKASNSYQTGLNVLSMRFSPQATDWGDFACGSADVANMEFINEGLEGNDYNISQAQWDEIGTPARSCLTMCIIPDSAVDATKRGRRIAAIGQTAGAGQAIFHRPKASTVWTSLFSRATNLGGGLALRARSDVDWNAPTTVYLGAHKSVNYGDDFAALGHKYLGMSMQDSNIIYGFETDGVYRSTNKGGAWSKFCDVSLTVGAPEAWVDRKNDQRIYTHESIGNNSYDLCCFTGTLLANVVKTSIPLAGMYPTGQVPVNMDIRSLASDYNDPTLFYVSVWAIGNMWLFMGRWNATFTAVTYTDITKNAPRVNIQGHIEVSRWTGELAIPTVNGLYYAAPPKDYKTTYSITHSIWDGLPPQTNNHYRDIIVTPPSGASHPMTITTAAKRDIIKSRVTAKQEPQWTAWNKATTGVKARADAALTTTYDPDPTYSFNTSGSGAGTVDYSRAEFEQHSLAAHSLAWAYLVTGTTSYADKAVAILSKWATDDVQMLPAGASHPGLHIGSYLVQFMYAADLLVGYSGWTSAKAGFETWWRNRVKPNLDAVIAEKMPNNPPIGSTDPLVEEMNNWLDAAMCCSLAFAIAFDDTVFRDSLIARAQNYFVNSSRYYFSDFVPSAADVPSARWDITRNSVPGGASGTPGANDILGPSQYLGYGQSSAAYLFLMCLHHGVNLFTATTPAGATWQVVMKNWIDWTYPTYQGFKHPTFGVVTDDKVQRQPTNHVNILEVYNNVYTSYSKVTNYLTANRPLTTSPRDGLATFTQGGMSYA